MKNILGGLALILSVDLFIVIWGMTYIALGYDVYVNAFWRTQMMFIINLLS